MSWYPSFSSDAGNSGSSGSIFDDYVIPISYYPKAGDVTNIVGVSRYMISNTYGCFIIGDNITNCASFVSIMCPSTYSFNGYIKFGNNITDCSNMFNNCQTFNPNYLLSIPRNVTNCRSMFYNCYSFNQPITIPDNVTNCSYMFYGCQIFNSLVTIGNNVTDCINMFSHCPNFNQPITIPDNVILCNNMFQNCNVFNQTIIIPNNVYGCRSMFANCKNMCSDIYIKRTDTPFSMTNMIQSHPTSKRINIYCSNLALLNKSSENTTLTGREMTWTSITNGYRDVQNNVYLYSNMPDGI